jgi:hypothetical protein
MHSEDNQYLTKIRSFNLIQQRIQPISDTGRVSTAIVLSRARKVSASLFPAIQRVDDPPLYLIRRQLGSNNHKYSSRVVSDSTSLRHELGSRPKCQDAFLFDSPALEEWISSLVKCTGTHSTLYYCPLEKLEMRRIFWVLCSIMVSPCWFQRYETRSE